MRIDREVPTTCTRTVTTFECDNCHKDVTSKGYMGNSCPSERPLMEIFIGFDSTRSEPFVYGTVYGSKYGVEGIEMCKNCRDDWFKDILKQFPTARLVKIND